VLCYGLRGCMRRGRPGLARCPGAHVAAPRTGVPCEILGGPRSGGVHGKQILEIAYDFVIGFPREIASTGTLWPVGGLGAGSAHAHTRLPLVWEQEDWRLRVSVTTNASCEFFGGSIVNLLCGLLLLALV
jgi:hypothetical protein